MKRFYFVRALTFMLLFFLCGCTTTAASPTETPSPPTPVPLELSSPVFTADSPIPMRHACHGENLSPPLSWTVAPAGTQSFVLIMDDPDAVQVVGRVWDHWLLFNIPSDICCLSASKMAIYLPTKWLFIPQ